MVKPLLPLKILITHVSVRGDKTIDTFDSRIGSEIYGRFPAAQAAALTVVRKEVGGQVLLARSPIASNEDKPAT